MTSPSHGARAPEPSPSHGGAPTVDIDGSPSAKHKRMAGRGSARERKAAPPPFAFLRATFYLWAVRAQEHIGDHLNADIPRSRRLATPPTEAGLTQIEQSNKLSPANDECRITSTSCQFRRARLCSPLDEHDRPLDGTRRNTPVLGMNSAISSGRRSRPIGPGREAQLRFDLV